MACGTITANVTYNCDSPPVAGVRSIVYLANFDEWQTWAKTLDGTNKNMVTAITAGTSEYLYKFEQPSSNNVKPKVDKVTTDVGTPAFTQSVAFLVPKVDADGALLADKLCKGRYVAFVVTNNETVEIYGYSTGLEVADGTIKDSYANSGMYVMTLQTSEMTPEAKNCYHFDAGTFAQTEAALLALVA